MGFSARGIAAGFLVVVVAAVCIRLGFWQLDRLEQRRAANQALAAGLALPPLVLNPAGLDSVAADPDRFRFRRATVQGRLDPGGTALLRGRARGGRPGVHLLGVLRPSEGDAALLVDRGWLPALDAMSADPRPYRETDAVTMEGVLLPLRAEGGDESPVAALVDGFEVLTLQRLSARAYQRVAAVPLLPLYLERTAGGAGHGGLPAPALEPEFDDGPHLGYAFQWFSFATIAVVGFLILAVRSRGTRAG